MGCLKLDIFSASGDIDANVKEVNDISFIVSIVKKKARQCMKMLFECINDILVNVKAVNDDSVISVEHAYPAMTISVGLVCKTNTGSEYYLQVLDGYLLTVDGCYVKVMKT